MLLVADEVGQEQSSSHVAARLCVQWPGPPRNEGLGDRTRLSRARCGGQSAMSALHTEGGKWKYKHCRLFPLSGNLKPKAVRKVQDIFEEK